MYDRLLMLPQIRYFSIPENIKHFNTSGDSHNFVLPEIIMLLDGY